MALKADRHELQTDISFFMNEVASRGGIACFSTAGSGAAMDSNKALVTYDATPSGSVPAGLLMNDMVNIDQTRQHINWHKDEIQKGGKVTLLTQGWVVTDRIYPGNTPAVGNVAYVHHSGYISATVVALDGQFDTTMPTNLSVGRFLSKKDEDGYAKVSINLPNQTHQ
tara:strand:+ start:7666 stop:8169 length:504 start_codon:yes stop_codon:yes gene_type:complete